MNKFKVQPEAGFVKANLPFLTILILGTFVRFINFSNRVNFGPEQAMSLIVSAKYINEKFSLLGQMYFRENAFGHVVFSGAMFNYFLVPLELVFKYNPIGITSIFTLINIFTGIFLYFFVSRIFGKTVASLSFLFFLFDARMIDHSLFIWNYNLLPILFLSSIKYLFDYWKNKSFMGVFLVALFCGLSISIQYLYILPTFIFFVLVLFRRRSFIIFLDFIAGLIVGNLPMVLFDLRHNLYHTRTLLSFFLEEVGRSGEFSFRYYHFIYLWPLIAVFLGYITEKILKINKIAALFIVIGFLFLNLNSNIVDFNKSVGMQKNLNASDIIDSAKFIAEVGSGKYNVVETYDFDSRANVLRYPISYMYGEKDSLLDDKEHKYSDAIFVLSPLNYDYNNPVPWELKVYLPYKVTLLKKINGDWGVFKITKT